MVEVFSVQDGLDAERALLDEVCGGAREHGLLLWQPCDRALVMPRRMERLEGFAPASAAVAERGWPVLLRDTGGEPVPQSPGVLNIALSYALGPGDNEQTRIETAYLRLCQPICDWLRERGLDAGVGAVAGSFCDGRYNVTLDGRKLAGTAQRWRRARGDGRGGQHLHPPLRQCPGLPGGQPSRPERALERFPHGRQPRTGTTLRRRPTLTSFARALRQE